MATSAAPDRGRFGSRAARIGSLALVATGALVIAVAHGGIAPIVAAAIVVPLVVLFLWLTPRLDARRHARDYEKDPALRLTAAATFDPDHTRRSVRVRISDRGIAWSGRRNGPSGEVSWGSQPMIALANGPRSLWPTTRMTIAAPGGSETVLLVSVSQETVERALSDARTNGAQT